MLTLVRTVTSGVTTWLNSTGFTQFYVPPTRLSTNGKSHFVSIHQMAPPEQGNTHLDQLTTHLSTSKG